MINTAVLFLIAILAFPLNVRSAQLPWPVDAKPAITSTFCEYRPGHFHSGIDLKTYGQIGPECRAVTDGWVSRVKVSEGGYGLALYLTLTDGRTAVYAHLDGFESQIEKLVRQEQLNQKQFAVELFFKKSIAIHYNQNEVVGYAGRSGVKHAHVHFEIRDVHERPQNPISEGLHVPDHSSPIPSSFALIPLDASSTVEMDHQPRIYRHLVKRHNGVWTNGDPIGINGRIGISIDAFDKADAAENLLAVYRLELLVNGERRWVTSFDEFSFADTRKLELERDYRLLRRGLGIFSRLYRETGNDLEFCSGDGIIEISEINTTPIQVEIVLSDIAGNSTTVVFTLVSDLAPSDNRLVGGRPLLMSYNWDQPERTRMIFSIFDNYIRLAAPPGIFGFILDGTLDICLPTKSIGNAVVATWVPPIGFNSHLKISTIGPDSIVLDNDLINIHPVFPDRNNQILSDDGLLSIGIPSGRLYDTMWVQYVKEPSFEVPDLIESVYRIEPMDQPLAGKVNISLKRAEGKPMSEGWGLYYLDSRRGWTFLGNDVVGGYLTAEALSWEVFGLQQDTDVPSIVVVEPRDKAPLTNSKLRFHFKVNDKTSGIVADDLSLTIDGERMPAEYDSPRDRLIFDPWWDLSPGEHSATVRVVDRVGNEATRVVNFVIADK